MKTENVEVAVTNN